MQELNLETGDYVEVNDLNLYNAAQLIFELVDRALMDVPESTQQKVSSWVRDAFTLGRQFGTNIATDMYLKRPYWLHEDGTWKKKEEIDRLKSGGTT